MIPAESVIQLFNEGFLPEDIIAKLGLNDLDRDELEAIIEEPANYMTEAQYRKRIERGFAAPAQSRVVT